MKGTATAAQRGLRERWGLCLAVIGLFAAVVSGYDMAAILGGVGILLAGAVVEAGETVAAAIRRTPDEPLAVTATLNPGHPLDASVPPPARTRGGCPDPKPRTVAAAAPSRSAAYLISSGDGPAPVPGCPATQPGAPDTRPATSRAPGTTLDLHRWR